MIKYGLKLWTNNRDLFTEAVLLYKKGIVDCIELYHNPGSADEMEYFDSLQEVPVEIHHTHTSGFHEFMIGPEQLEIWEGTRRLADYLGAQKIIVHPGQNHTFESFFHELEKIEDSRILIENMAGLDINGHQMYAHTLEQLKQIAAVKPICFDFEKAAKAAVHQGLDYKAFIADCVDALKPTYFHISGGDLSHAVDEHTDLWDSDIDAGWIRTLLEKKYEQSEAMLVFETPKANGLDNDIENMEYFRSA